MAPLTIPNNFKFKSLFLFHVDVTTIVESVDVEMIVETLILLFQA
jgi:hypothetical protein